MNKPKIQREPARPPILMTMKNSAEEPIFTMYENGTVVIHSEGELDESTHTFFAAIQHRGQTLYHRIGLLTEQLHTMGERNKTLEAQKILQDEEIKTLQIRVGELENELAAEDLRPRASGVN